MALFLLALHISASKCPHQGFAPGKVGKEPGDSHLEICSAYGASQGLGRAPQPCGEGGGA